MHDRELNVLRSLLQSHKTKDELIAAIQARQASLEAEFRRRHSEKVEPGDGASSGDKVAGKDLWVAIPKTGSLPLRWLWS